MNVLILAAGYATRLHPLTSNKAKPLLDVAGKPMLAWVVYNLRGIAGIETIYIVTNEKFSGDFETWAKNYQRANPEFRFKIVNDGSTDTTAEVLKRYDDRIRVLYQQNRGPAAARNAAVAQSNAEYIAFLDADDAFMSDKLARTLPGLASAILLRTVFVCCGTSRSGARRELEPGHAREVINTDTPINSGIPNSRSTSIFLAGRGSGLAVTFRSLDLPPRVRQPAKSCDGRMPLI